MKINQNRRNTRTVYRPSKTHLFAGLIIILVGLTLAEFSKLRSNPMGKAGFVINPDAVIEVPFNMSAGCNPQTGWHSTLSILIDGIPRGTIQDCGSTFVKLKPGSHKVKVSGDLSDPDKMNHSVESEETINDIHKTSKFILFPSTTKEGVFTVKIIQNCKDC